MRLFISDANILIDMEKGELTKYFFSLPFEFAVPDFLYADELEKEHSHLVKMGLVIRELPFDVLEHGQALHRRHFALSTNDCFALALAFHEKCLLLTGDKKLKNAAAKEGVKVKGSVWVIGQMLKYKIISFPEARLSYQRMLKSDRRLPLWEDVEEIFRKAI